MICCSEQRFFMSNLFSWCDWTQNLPATQIWGDVESDAILAMDASESIAVARFRSVYDIPIAPLSSKNGYRAA